MPPLEPPAPSNEADQSQQRVCDAASLVITKIDHNNTVCVLMGRRHPDTAFLPNKYVFPGGRFEPSDSSILPARPLSPHNQNLLMQSVAENTTPADMHALALTAIRETFEETGVVVGYCAPRQQETLPSGWQRFFDTGHCPDPSGLHFFARAITPPGRPRRYDTRFFWASATNITTRVEPTDDELDDIDWVSLEEARGRDIASITHHILADLERLTAPDQSVTNQARVPFYHYQNQTFERVLLSHQDGIA